jgi:hypothetical protein
MTRRILSCQGKCSLGQPSTPKEEPDTQTASTIYQIPFSPSAGLIRKSSQSPPPADSASIKRERSGQPVTHARNQSFRSSQSSLYGYSSEDDSDSSSSASGSDSDDSSCSDSEHSSPGAAQEYVLSHDHRFQSSRPELLKSSLDSLDAWMKSARYVLPPDDSLPSGSDSGHHTGRRATTASTGLSQSSPRSDTSTWPAHSTFTVPPDTSNACCNTTCGPSKTLSVIYGATT